MADDTRIRAIGGEGILGPEDLDELGAAESRVAMLMADCRWHHASEIRQAAGKDGHPASEGLRRFRAVRARLEPKGYRFERERGEGRDFRYRMLPMRKPQTQTLLSDPRLFWLLEDEPK